MNSIRHYSFLDKLCIGIDQALRVLTHTPTTTNAAYPAANVNEKQMSDSERKHAAGLMRVNHTGEICAQGLYHGQALFSRSTAIQAKMTHAAIEEGDHLVWCKTRLDELASHTSYLNPFWYAGSFMIGITAGLAGDGWSLGFVAETERQVLKHLETHIEKLPSEDARSAAILTKMIDDEASHRDEAVALGANDLPNVIKFGMGIMSKIMVKTTYWV